LPELVNARVDSKSMSNHSTTDGQQVSDSIPLSEMLNSLSTSSESNQLQ